MKYILTKDYEIITLVANEKEWLLLSKEETAGLPYEKWFKFATEGIDILKSTDTIEELCDEFVIAHYFKETNYTHCEVLKENKELLIESVKLRKQDKDYDQNEFEIYGAIWTDKGLIYVAKMNEKGTLELL